MITKGCKGIETCLVLRQGPIKDTKNYGIHFEPPSDDDSKSI